MPLGADLDLQGVLDRKRRCRQLADFKRRKPTNMAVDKHGRDVFLADTSYALTLAQENFKEIRFKFTSEF